MSFPVATTFISPERPKRKREESAWDAIERSGRKRGLTSPDHLNRDGRREEPG
jgi:hypothetical protein